MSQTISAEQAILAIRHVVQEHAGEEYHLGSPGSCDGKRWFGELLGWSWPKSYLDVISKHDGVKVCDAILFSFVESVDRFLWLHARWHRPDGFWPVGGDGCGNYFALAMGEPSGECPVVFFDMSESSEKPQITIAESYATFVIHQMAEQCQYVGCNGPLSGRD